MNPLAAASNELKSDSSVRNRHVSEYIRGLRNLRDSEGYGNANEGATIRTMSRPLTGISVTRFWAESILPSPGAYAGVHVNRAGISARSRQKDEMRLVNFSPIR